MKAVSALPPGALSLSKRKQSYVEYLTCFASLPHDTMASLKTLYEPNTDAGNALHTNFEYVWRYLVIALSEY
jgi:hypothetical protein